MQISAHIKALRNASEMRQIDVMSEMNKRGFNWGLDTLPKIERNKRKLLFDEAVALADVFGISFNQLAIQKDDTVFKQVKTMAKFKEIDSELWRINQKLSLLGELMER